jgi:hypothetical protein
MFPRFDNAQDRNIEHLLQDENQQDEIRHLNKNGVIKTDHIQPSFSDDFIKKPSETSISPGLLKTVS